MLVLKRNRHCVCYVNSWYWVHGGFEGTFICLGICVFVVWISMYARTICILVLYWSQVMKCTIEDMRSLSRWLCRRMVFEYDCL